MAELKICSTCKVVKPLSEFHKAASQKTGLNPLGVFEGMGSCWLRRAWNYLKGGE